MSRIEKALSIMHACKSSQEERSKKGTYGEKAALEVLLEYIKKRGGMIFHSYEYPYQVSPYTHKTYVGNIFNIEMHNSETLEGGKGWKPDVVSPDGKYGYKFDSKSVKDEVDLLMVTPRVIIPIEIKAYHRKMRFFDCWWDSNSKFNSKCPTAQAEKHARHLYHFLCDLLPDGNAEYIKPTLCLVDDSSITDERSKEQEEYIKICTLNSLKKTIYKIDEEKEFCLDYLKIIDYLKDNKIGYDGIYF